MQKIDIYLAGNIQKDYENESQIYYRENDLKKIRETLSFIKKIKGIDLEKRGIYV